MYRRVPQHKTWFSIGIPRLSGFLCAPTQLLLPSERNRHNKLWPKKGRGLRRQWGTTYEGAEPGRDAAARRTGRSPATMGSSPALQSTFRFCWVIFSGLFYSLFVNFCLFVCNLRIWADRFHKKRLTFFLFIYPLSFFWYVYMLQVFVCLFFNFRYYASNFIICFIF